MNESVREVYETVLNRQLKIFPMYFWEGDEGKIRGFELARYLIEDKLKLSEDEIKNITKSFFIKYKLAGMLKQCYNSSPTDILLELYPHIHPWEFKSSPNNYWNYESGISAVKWLIETKLKWSKDDVRNKINVKTFADNRLHGMLNLIFDGSPIKAITAAYPNEYRYWEFESFSKNYWNNKTTREALIWLIETELKWNDDDIRDKFNHIIFVKYGLHGMLYHHFNDSPYLALKFLYPDRFKPNELKKSPHQKTVQ